VTMALLFCSFLFCSVVVVKHTMDAKKFVTSILDYALNESAYKPQGKRVFGPPLNWIPAVTTKGQQQDKSTPPIKNNILYLGHISLCI
jgi:hypothetical protein